MIRVFFDTSVLFSAIYSDCGASAQLLRLTSQHKIIGVTTETVLDELHDNVQKFPHIKDINEVIHKSALYIREFISIEEAAVYNMIVHPKDAHVLAGAILTECEYLVTLDKKHLNNKDVKEKVKKIVLVSPKELLEIVQV